MLRKDILYEKTDRINAYLNRLKEFERLSEADFLIDLSAQEAVLLNFVWAIQVCVDMASFIAADQNWRLPGSMGELFDSLHEHNAISETTRKTMRAMVGFRHRVVHDYAKLDLKQVHNILRNHLNDFSVYLKEISTFAQL